MRLWDRRDGRERLTLRGHAGPVSAVAFSPDSQRLISASLDGTIKVWDADSGQEIQTLRGHVGAIESLAFDGQRIVSGGKDKTVRIWDGTRPEGIAP